MTALSRAALVAAFVATSIPTVAEGQNVSADSLLRRIDSLQRRTVDLERRVAELEALIRAEPSRSRAVPASPNPRDVANWRRLRRGMTMDAVRALLGEPESVSAGGSLTMWTYPDLAFVSFSSEKVDGWSEPRR